MAGEQKPIKLANGFEVDDPVFLEANRVRDDGSEEFCRRIGGVMVGGPLEYADCPDAHTVLLNEPIPPNAAFAIKHPITFNSEAQWITDDDGVKHELRYRVLRALPIVPKQQ